MPAGEDGGGFGVSEEEVWGERVREEGVHFVGLKGRGREGRGGDVACCDAVIVNVIPVSWEDQRLWLWFANVVSSEESDMVWCTCACIFSFPFLVLFCRRKRLFNWLEKERREPTTVAF